MENTKFIYAVNSDLDDELLYAEFETEEAAIEYATKHLNKLPFVDKVELVVDDGGYEDAISYTTIWDHTMVNVEPEAEETDYWDMIAAHDKEEKENTYDLGDNTWFESVDTDNLVEAMEENEDMVECKECFDLFPKADCVKLEIGYICPQCNCGYEVADEDIFKVDFPEYEKMAIENDMIPEEPISEVEPSEEVPASEPANSEEEPELTPEEAIPFLVNDEVEAVVGYEKAAEVVADSDLENKEEILDTLDHIKEEEEEHIEELQDLVDDEIVEVENDPISNEETELLEKIDIDTTDLVSSGNAEIWGIEPVADNKYKAILLKSYKDLSYYPDTEQEVFDEMYKIDGLFTFGFTKSGAPELHAWNTEIWRTLSGCEIIFEDPAYDAALEKVFSKAESLNEHVNKECSPIESDQELEGTDNAVVDCKVADVITHSEDEKPVDCEGEKKPLEKSLTEGVVGKLNKDTEDDIEEFNKLCKEIGINTVSELDRFIKEVGTDGNLLDKIRAYRDELGNDFKLKEGVCTDCGGKTENGKCTSCDRDYNLAKCQKCGGEVKDGKCTSCDELHEDTHAQYAKPAGDRLKSYNQALFYAKKYEKPFIYGYTARGTGKFFALEQPIKIKGDSADAEKEFRSQYKNCSTVYVAYPNKDYAKLSEALYNFTEEEMVEYNMDEDGVSLNSYDEYVRCNWCGEIYTADQCVFEADLGWLCDRCYSAIRSRGEKLTILTNPTDEEIAKTLTEAIPMSRDEVIAKEGTDDVDLINAGRPEDERVEIVD